jgi:hypothetical protein
MTHTRVNQGQQMEIIAWCERLRPMPFEQVAFAAAPVAAPPAGSEH